MPLKASMALFEVWWSQSTLQMATLLKDKQKIINRWAEHFQEPLNRVSPSDPTVLEELPTFIPLGSRT